MRTISRSLRTISAALLVAVCLSPGDARSVDGSSDVLVDQYGREMPASRLSGRYLFVYFGYASCPDICPTALATMSRTLDLLGTRGESVLPLFVTVDPRRDTVAVMRSYVSHFDRRFIGLTGSTTAVTSALAAFGVTATPAPPDVNGAYSLEHSLFIYFAGPDGKVLQTFHASQSASSMASDISKRLSVSAPVAGSGR